LEEENVDAGNDDGLSWLLDDDEFDVVTVAVYVAFAFASGDDMVVGCNTLIRQGERAIMGGCCARANADTAQVLALRRRETETER